jgi:hypothetical protein
MRTRLRNLVLTVGTCAYLLGVAGAAHAIIADHLKCVKAKAIEPKSTYNIASLGCIIKGPAKLVCTPVVKAGVSPTPPGGGPTGATTKFVCYKAKCPKIPGTVTAKDQFGTHVFATSTVKTICAPASPSGAFLDASAF